MEISERSKVSPGAGVVFRRLSQGRGGVLLKLETSAYHSLNETGGVLWELMEEGKALTRIVDEFSRMLDEDPVGLDNDVAAFFQDLESRDLIRVSTHEATGPSTP